MTAVAPLTRGPGADPAFLVGAVHTEHGPDERLTRAGTPMRELLVVTHGVVRLYGAGPDGRPRLDRLVGPGHLLGLDALLDGGSWAHTAVAHERVGLARLDATVALRDRADLAGPLLAALGSEFRRSRALLTLRAVSDAHGRVAGTVLELADLLGIPVAGGTFVRHGFNQTELAELAGAVRETVSRCLRRFADAGWVTVRDHELVVRDHAALAVRAGLIARRPHRAGARR